MSDFATFVLSQLPPPPARVLEIGCGEEGGVVPALLDAGYDALGVDPRAPGGEHYRRIDFRCLAQRSGARHRCQDEFDAVVAGRVLHHVRPLDEALDRVAALALLLVVDEFAWDLIDAAAQEWYESRHRELVEAGAEPYGPPSLDEWRLRHPDLHPHAVRLEGLRARYRERTLEWRPYFYRWLQDPASEALERSLPLPSIGWRWAGVR